MKLAIIRHAHANAIGSSGDFSRELSIRGHRQASLTSEYLQTFGFIPDYAIVSAAVRTIQTSKDFAFHCPIDFSQAAYNASALTLAQIVREVPANAKCIALLAHNPGVTDLAIACGYDTDMMTATAVIVEWSGVATEFEIAEMSILGSFSPNV